MVTLLDQGSEQENRNNDKLFMDMQFTKKKLFYSWRLEWNCPPIPSTAIHWKLEASRRGHVLMLNVKQS